MFWCEDLFTKFDPTFYEPVLKKKTLTKSSTSRNLNRIQLSLFQTWIQTKNEMISDQPGGALMGNSEIRAPLVDLLWWAHWEQRTVVSPPFRPPPHTLQSLSSSSVPSPSLELSLKHATSFLSECQSGSLKLWPNLHYNPFYGSRGYYRIYVSQCLKKLVGWIPKVWRQHLFLKIIYLLSI